jgi:tetratricopeptide (TPR) repeat protein
MTFLGLLLPLLAAQATPPKGPPIPPAPTNLAADAVVRVTNGLVHGSGFVIDEKGYLLTNVHVAGSPLPYTVEVEVVRPARASESRLTFRKVLLAGVHPRRDLALLKIDPAEHRMTLKKLTLREGPVAVGEEVSAVGYPGDVAGGRELRTTRGRVQSTQRILFRQDHLGTDVSVWFGNSGGPLLDSRGEVAGVVTLKESPTDTALAIPATDLRLQYFVPLRQRLPDPTRALELQNSAEKAFREFRESGNTWALSVGIAFLTKAVTIDVGNEDPLMRVGAILILQGKMREAAAFLTRALQLKPWPSQGQKVYVALALALLRMQRPEEAITVAEEGIAKFPTGTGDLWQLMGQAYQMRNNRSMAAAAETIASRNGGAPPERGTTPPGRRPPIWTPEETEAIRAQERRFEERLREAAAAAPRAREARTAALTPAFAKFLTTFDGVQHEGAVEGIDLRRGASVVQDASKYADDEVAAMFVRGQLAVAKEHLSTGRRELGIQTLQSIVKNHPGCPEAREAEILLQVLEKK